MHPCHFAKFGCDVLSDDVVAHRAKCVFRPVECQFGCPDNLRFHEQAEHYRTCPNVVADSPAGNAITCSVPDCGRFPSWQQGFHNVANLRSHMLLLANLESLQGKEETVRSVLKLALDMWPEDLCVACKLAEGDTMQCKECSRHLHEECDGGDNFVAKGFCYECKSHRGDLKHEEEPGSGSEAEGDAIELDGEHFDEDNEELSSESGETTTTTFGRFVQKKEKKGNLTGFVVDDDVVSYSSESELLSEADRRIEKQLKAKKRARRAPEDEKPAEKRARPKILVIASSESNSPMSKKERGSTSKSKKNVIESSSLSVTPKRKKKKTFQGSAPTGSKRAGLFLDAKDSSSMLAIEKEEKKKKKKKKKKEKKENDDNDDFK